MRPWSIFHAGAPLLGLTVLAACSNSVSDAKASGDADPPHEGGNASSRPDGRAPVEASSGCGLCDEGGSSSGATRDAGGDAHGASASSSSVTHDAGHDALPPIVHESGASIVVATATGSVMRTYDITYPTGCETSHPVPVIFAFHGDGGSGAGMYASFPIEAAAAAAGGKAVFVYPDGTNNNIDLSGEPRAWDIAHDPGPFPYKYTPGQAVPAESDEASGNLDVDFFDAMLESFEKTYCVDKSRVYVTGMSSGGYFTNQLARWRAGVVKGAAPQSGGAPYGNNDSTTGTWSPPNYCISSNGKVPALIIHGLADTVVDPCNAIEAQSYWEMTNGCEDSANNCTTMADTCTGSMLAAPSTAPTTTSPLNADCQATSGCGSDPVVYCAIPGMGHQIWSDAPSVIWTFFSSL
jgi:polyhydroxybutyrate depolymerase